jgi:hypothetical protein
MDPEGHEFLTKKAVEAAIRSLPADLNWVRPYLPDAVITSAVYRDSEDWLTLDNLRDRGQRNHFMQFAGQGTWNAYKAGHDWIYVHAYETVKRLRRIWQRPLHGAELAQIAEHCHNSVKCSGDPFHHGITPSPVELDEYSCNPLIDVAGPLGDALHALQNSYSPAHTRRKKVGERWIIDDIFVWAHQKFKAHQADDTKWKTDELGKEAIVASRELIGRVVASSVMRMEHEVKWKWDSLWGKFASGFLGQNLGSEPGRYPDRSTE